jgi:tetratricopeptide (TPR) repeat protein
MSDVSGELAYVFRHAMVREGAYQLQLPSARAKLHALALVLVEEAFGGRAPEPPPLEAAPPPPFVPHNTDNVAAELALHAEFAIEGMQDDPEARNLPALRLLYLRRAAEHAERHFNNREAVKHWQRLADLLDGETKCEATRRAGVVMARSGQLQEAGQVLQAALEFARECGSRTAEATTLVSLGDTLQQSGHIAKAIPLYEEAIAIARDLKLHELELGALGNQAILYLRTGQFEKGAEELRILLEEYRRTGNKEREAAVTGNLANYYGELRKPEAEEWYQRAIEMHRALGNRREVGAIYNNLAATFKGQHRIEEADAAYRQSLKLVREVGARHVEALTLSGYAGMFILADKAKLAFAHGEQALKLARECGDRRLEGVTLSNLASWRMQIREYEEAEKLFRQAHAVHEQIRNTFAAAYQRGMYARCLLHLGREEEARAEWQAGMEALSRLGAKRHIEELVMDMQMSCEALGVEPPLLGPDE